ncbi:MAG: hypothetical protein CMM08_04160 [Rhodospirillaceae bacterium]|nr:hypothetical protein [Rhodospirillaceae bacterium]
MEKRRIVRGGLEARLGRISDGRRHLLNAGAETQLLGDPDPFLRLGQNAQSYVAHFGILSFTKGAAQARGEQDRK